MIDYVDLTPPPAIVQYAAEVEILPNTNSWVQIPMLPGWVSSGEPSVYYPESYSMNVGEYDKNWIDINLFAVGDNPLYAFYLDISGDRVFYGGGLYSLNGERLPVNGELPGGDCYFVVYVVQINDTVCLNREVITSDWAVYRTYIEKGSAGIPSSFTQLNYVRSADLPSWIKYDGSLGVPVEVSKVGDIFWLYNFGRTLFTSGITVSDVLDFEIAGHNLLSLLFTTGFVVYMGWCVFKWVIPT